jgi:UDP-N-acetylglucosamine 1-carboxyvinyltransferase
MAKFIIKGGNELQGILTVNGSKNSALPILCATLLARGEHILNNVPNLSDIDTMIKMLEVLGLEVIKMAEHKYRIINNGIKNIEAPYELVSIMRASFLVMGPLLAAEKKARVSLPGGCAIGARPVNYHLQGFEKLGAKITMDNGFMIASAEKLIGTEIVLPFPSVGATENILMAAVLAEGKTVLKNVAKEPEITDLCNFLNKMGAKISGIDSDTLIIDGVKELHPTEHTIIPDRLEAGTFIILSAITGGKVQIKGLKLEHLSAFKNKLSEIGVEISDGGILKISNELKPVQIITEPEPGFPTDLQAQTMVLLGLAKGRSTIKETVFENRFLHVPELNRLGMNIIINGQEAVVDGGVKLSGAKVTATDIRGGVALVLAALIAKGVTEIDQIKYIERGYEDLAGRLKMLGAEIERIEDV